MEDNIVDFPGGFVPFDTYVVKIASRCNLNCDYCYMYNLEDKTWRNQPAVMPDEVTAALGKRIAQYSQRHRLSSVHIILHGGEPLLVGRRRLASWVGNIRGLLDGYVRPAFSIQSNGVLIDEDWIEVLAELRVKIGISLDGPAEFHDLHRRDHFGNGSFNDVVKAIRLLRSHQKGPSIFSTVMAVVDTNIPPQRVFDLWQELDVPGFDLSLPHANHAHLPNKGVLSYGDWLIQFFDLWFTQNRPDRKIRYFENMIRCLFGYPYSTDNIGGKPVGVVVIETDGSIEPTDAFKCCENGITKIGYNILEDDLELAQNLPMVKVLQGGAKSLCSTCKACPLIDICGGGYMPHRYSAENGFDNPSVYCRDLERLIRHIRYRVLEALPDSIHEQLAREGRVAYL
jgi:uncharacterized protein